MPTLNLTAQNRSALRAAAHPLRPVVWIGDKGLTDAVLKEIDAMLAAHPLIKVRVAGHERQARDQMLTTICAQLSCAAVHHLGKTLILYRPAPEKPETTRAVRKPSQPYTAKKLAAAGKTPARKTGKPQRTKPAAKSGKSVAKPAATRPAKPSTRSALSLRAGARRGTRPNA